ncbi:MAG: lycopene cyclase family protein, partial [Pseudomonadota bacterium]
EQGYRADRCDVVYRGSISPDFYGWVFPHGGSASIGMGSQKKGVNLRRATAQLRKDAGLAEAETIREEGAPIPLKPLKKWDNGRDVVLAGDAAGVVAPASGEGIYYAMLGGELAAGAVVEALAAETEKARAKALATARKRFMKDHGRVFWALGLLQWFWYASDARRERFVSMCADPDVQRLTWEAYMNKELVKRQKKAHARVIWKDIKHLLGLVPADSQR